MAWTTQPLQTRSRTTTRSKLEDCCFGAWSAWNLQQPLLLSVKPTSTWQKFREIVENYYSSTFVPNPTTGHIAYLAHGSEENVNYVKGGRKGKRGKGKKEGDNYKGKGKSKGKGKQGDYNKRQRTSSTTKESNISTTDLRGDQCDVAHRGDYPRRISPALQQRTRNDEKEKGWRSRTTTSVDAVKAANKVGTRILRTRQTGPHGVLHGISHSRITALHHSTRQWSGPVETDAKSLLQLHCLMISKRFGQCMSGSYVGTRPLQHARAPIGSGATASATSVSAWSTTDLPVALMPSHVYCEELNGYYCPHLFEINYSQQITEGMNPAHARELPAHYVNAKHWELLVDTGAWMLVLLQSTLPLRHYWSQYYNQFSYSQLHQHPSRSTAQRRYYCFQESCLSTFASTSQTWSRHYWICTTFYKETYIQLKIYGTPTHLLFKKVMLKSHYCSMTSTST